MQSLMLEPATVYLYIVSDCRGGGGGVVVVVAVAVGVERSQALIVKC